MAKIEKPEAVEQFDAILQEVDGIMVARGDLGIELAAEKVPLLQKMMIEKCLKAAKPVVVATQMLDSMIRNPRPTRAEVSDVANAVIDKTDATMLSGETASGAYPVEAVQVMAKTIHEVETSKWTEVSRDEFEQGKPKEAMTNVAAVLARARKPKAMLVVSRSGETARLVSRYRSNLPIFACSADPRIARQTNILWGTRPFWIENKQTVSELIEASITTLKEKKYIATGDEVIVVAGEAVDAKGMVNFVELLTV